MLVTDTQSFISKARRVHGDRYQYHLVRYKNCYTPVAILCKQHGLFVQAPSSHNNGRGCPECGKIKYISALTLTTEEFIRRAIETHGDRYGYSNTEYIRTDVKLVVTCKIHGDFEVYPHNHLRGVHCPMCSKKGKRNTNLFIQNAKTVHGGRYDYSKVEYKDARSKVIIICREHGQFDQTPTDHLSGKNCSRCAGNYVPTIAEFIEKARKTHGDRYQYEKAVYAGSHNNLTITCDEHGDFEQTPTSHLGGRGCPSCSSTGYDPNKPGHVYVLLSEDIIKVGITNTPKDRFRRLRRSTPFSFSVLELFEVRGEYAPIIEKFAHRKLKSKGLTDFDGATEWFHYDGSVLDDLRLLVEILQD